MALAATCIEPERTASSDALIVTLSITQWQICVTDKEAGKVTAQHYAASEETGFYQKYLVDRKAKVIKDVDNAFNRIRIFHKENTLPWENRTRLLPPGNYEHYKAGMADLEKAAWAAVDALCTCYYDLVDQAAASMGGLHKNSEYPSLAGIKEKYSIDIAYSPVPDASHFHLEWLSEAERKHIEEEAVARRAAAEKAAMDTLWVQLYEVVDKMAKTLADPDAVFRSTQIKSIASLVEILPRMNVSSDPSLERMTSAVKRQLLDYDPELLRTDTDLRKEAAETAEALSGRIRRVAKIIF
jgi:hypothetical protein